MVKKLLLTISERSRSGCLSCRYQFTTGVPRQLQYGWHNHAIGCDWMGITKQLVRWPTRCILEISKHLSQHSPPPTFKPQYILAKIPFCFILLSLTWYWILQVPSFSTDTIHRTWPSSSNEIIPRHTPTLYTHHHQTARPTNYHQFTLGSGYQRASKCQEQPSDPVSAYEDWVLILKGMKRSIGRITVRKLVGLSQPPSRTSKSLSISKDWNSITASILRLLFVPCYCTQSSVIKRYLYPSTLFPLLI